MKADGLQFLLCAERHIEVTQIRHCTGRKEIRGLYVALPILNGHDLSASRPVRFTFEERDHCAHRQRQVWDPRDGLNAFDDRKTAVPSGI